MMVILLGAPGVGKGTQAQILAQREGWVRISTGDLLREEVAAGTALGRQAQQVMARGELVSDALIGEIVRQKLEKPEARSGVVFDGFPRTLAQARWLDRMVEDLGRALDAVLHLSLPEAQIVRRISGRRSCPNCQALYHVESRPPDRQQLCDRCGGPLVQRDDDRPEVVTERLRVYREQTAPLLAFYRDRGQRVVEIDGAGSVEVVGQRIRRALGRP
jgi:adenylate kinase